MKKALFILTLVLSLGLNVYMFVPAVERYVFNECLNDFFDKHSAYPADDGIFLHCTNKSAVFRPALRKLGLMK